MLRSRRSVCLRHSTSARTSSELEAGWQTSESMESPLSLQLEKLWDRNIALTTRLVDTVTLPMLLKVVLSGKVEPAKLITHRFELKDILKAYETFGNAAKEHALKVILTNK